MTKYACCVCYQREAVKRLRTNLDLGYFLLCGKKKCFRQLMKSLKTLAVQFPPPPAKKSQPAVNVSSQPTWRKWLWIPGILLLCALLILFL